MTSLPAGQRPLTARELQVVAAAADGLTNGETAARLWLSTNTIKSHIARILTATQAPNMTAVVARALREGWIP